MNPRGELAAATAISFILVLVLSFLTAWNATPSDNSSKYFRVPDSGPVAIHIGEGSHYDLESEQGALEYAKLLPSHGHTVLAPSPSSSELKPYTVSLFHQLKCLGILRHEHNQPGSEPLTHHCLTYLRQTILCRPNLRIESVRTSAGSASRGYDAICPGDWTSVYQAAEENHARYAEPTSP